MQSRPDLEIQPSNSNEVIGAVDASLRQAYPAAIAFVARTGSFNTLHKADRFSSRGRTRSDSQK